MALDIGLIVSATIIPFLLIFFNVIVMAKYIDPEAAAGHFIAKLVILIGMLIAECTVLLLPMDVANQSGAVGCGAWNNNCGGLDMVMTWQVAYCVIVAMVVVIMPFFIFYYEADDEGMEAKEKGEGCLDTLALHFSGCKRSCCSAIVNTIIITVVGVIGFFVLYAYIAYTQIPYKLITASVDTVAFRAVGSPFSAPIFGDPCPTGSVCACGSAVGCTSTSNTLRMDVTAVVFMTALLCFVGWFVFSIYVGIGFVALPMDSVYAFIHRPKMLSVGEVRNQRKALMKRSEELIKFGEEMCNSLLEKLEATRSRFGKRRVQREHKAELNKFRAFVDQLEKDLDTMQLGDPQNFRNHYNPLVPYFKLVGGVISGLLSVLWIIQIIVYMLFNP
jgi:LMBR1 domain-containing protein 1